MRKLFVLGALLMSVFATEASAQCYNGNCYNNRYNGRYNQGYNNGMNTGLAVGGAVGLLSGVLIGRSGQQQYPQQYYPPQTGPAPTVIILNQPVPAGTVTVPNQRPIMQSAEYFDQSVGTMCRAYPRRVTGENGRPYEVTGRMCKMPNGTWREVN